MYHTTFRRKSAGRRIAPAAAALSLVLLAVASVQAGGEAQPTPPVPPVASTAPGAPRVESLITTASPAADSCNAVTGTCRALPVEGTVNDRAEGLARTAYDGAGRLEYTLWYDGTDTTVGAPLGL